MPSGTIWTEESIADLEAEVGDVYRGRTVVVTGADGFMGSHLTNALVALGVCEEHGSWASGRAVVSTHRRYPRGRVMALRVGHEKLTRETGWMPKVSWEEGVLQTIRWYAENRDKWIGRVDRLTMGAPPRTVAWYGSQLA